MTNEAGHLEWQYSAILSEESGKTSDLWHIILCELADFLNPRNIFEHR